MKSYSPKLPKLTYERGFVSGGKVGADVSKLKIVTADIGGPNYVVTK
ncbi:hypothetical protein OFO16_18930 [Vibrio natriegens]|nr:hypothetical protein [Vibrio natriegens]UYI50068.1 hypothetical protein OFO16_18930 [Vibrio natriegens]